MDSETADDVSDVNKPSPGSSVSEGIAFEMFFIVLIFRVCYSFFLVYIYLLKEILRKCNAKCYCTQWV